MQTAIAGVAVLFFLLLSMFWQWTGVSSRSTSDEVVGYDGIMSIFGVFLWLGSLGFMVVGVVSFVAVLGLPLRLTRRVRQWVAGHPLVPGAVAAAGALVWIVSLALLGADQGSSSKLGAVAGCVCGCLLLAFGLVHFWVPSRLARHSSPAQAAVLADPLTLALEGQDPRTVRAVVELAERGFLAERKNVIVVAEAVAGAELTSALWQSAAAAGYRGEAASITEWLTRLDDARTRGTLPREWARIVRNDLVVINDVGSVTVDDAAVADLLWPLVSQIGDSTSIIVSASMPPERWGEIFGPTHIAGRLARFLARGAHIVQLDDINTGPVTGSSKSAGGKPRS